MLKNTDENTDFFDILTGVLQEDTIFVYSRPMYFEGQ